jgi:hypothetical protein
MTDREGFEAQLENKDRARKNENGFYIWDYIQHQWIGWQAACKYKDEERVKAVPSTDEQSKKVALQLAQKWWSENKLSYNWNPIEDVEFLAAIIENKELF